MCVCVSVCVCARVCCQTSKLGSQGPFIGRAAEIQVLYNYITSGEYKVVTVSGPEGLGKTDLVRHVCHMLKESEHVRGGIFLLDMQTFYQTPPGTAAPSFEDHLPDQMSACLASQLLEAKVCVCVCAG